MPEIICNTSSQLLEKLSDIDNGKHALVSVKGNGKVCVEVCNDIKWRLATALPGGEARMIEKVRSALIYLAEERQTKLSREYNPITGHRNEAVVEFDGYRIPASVFADQVRRMYIPNESNIGLAIQDNLIWATVRRAEDPKKTDTGATQCQSADISIIQQELARKLDRDVQQHRKTKAYKTNETTTINARRNELRIKLKAWQNKNTTDNAIDSEDQAPYKTAVKRVLDAFNTNAKRLDLSDLSLKSLPPLDGLFKLESLNLNSNQLELFHVLLKDFPVLPSLIEITSGDDSTAALALPANFEAHAPKFYALNKLDKWLSEQQCSDTASLENFKTAVGRIKQAIISNSEDLDLSDLGLKTLPPLAGLSSVRTINLSGNSLTEVESLPVLPSVREIDLSNNVLQYLPSDLAVRFPQAVRLNLSDNLLTVIPAATKMPKRGPSEPFELQLLSGNFLTRATVRAHCDPKFFPADFSLGDPNRRNAFYNDSVVFVDSEAAYENLLSDINRFRHENPKFSYALEQWPSAKKVIEQRASYTDRYNTHYGKLRSGSVPTAHWGDDGKFSDAVAYFFCLANKEIPPGLFDQLMEPFSDGLLVTERTIQSLKLDLHKYTQIIGFSTTKQYDMDVITRKEVAHRIVMLLKEAAKNEDTRRDLIDTAGEASSTCEDRAALSLFERGQVMLVNKMIAEYSSAVSEPEKQYQQQQLLSMFKEIALIREVNPLALKMVLKRNLGKDLDRVEVVLSFYVALRELGYLSFAPDRMNFLWGRHHGAFSLKEIKAKIPELLNKVASKDLYEIAAQVPEWEAFMLKNDPECKKGCDDALAKRSAALDALYDDNPEKIEAFKRSFSEKRDLQNMDDHGILERIDDECQADKSKVLAERSRHFLSEAEPLPRALSPQLGPLHSQLGPYSRWNDSTTPNHSIQS